MAHLQGDKKRISVYDCEELERAQTLNRLKEIQGARTQPSAAGGTLCLDLSSLDRCRPRIRQVGWAGAGQTCGRAVSKAALVES